MQTEKLSDWVKQEEILRLKSNNSERKTHVYDLWRKNNIKTRKKRKTEFL